MKARSRSLATDPAFLQVVYVPLMRHLALILILLFALPAWSAEYAARVVKIADGATITVLRDDNTQERVRLASIDAPERGQPYGTRAKEALAALVFDQNVRVKGVDVDRYGRTVGSVWVVDVNVNAEMVRQGYAWVYRKYSDDPALLALEAEARAAKKGLWADSDPVPPWEWRRR
jgi:endonuclease YncB( thermonuclease family)